MMQATTSPSLPCPVMTRLPGLSCFLTKPHFLMRAHAPIARERARDLHVFAQGFCRRAGDTRRDYRPSDRFWFPFYRHGGDVKVRLSAADDRPRRTGPIVGNGAMLRRAEGQDRVIPLDRSE
jgi:hypothetical protein